MSNPHPTLSLWKEEAADRAICSLFHCVRNLAGELREKLGDQGLSRFQGAARRIGVAATRRDADQHGRAPDAWRPRTDQLGSGNNPAELGTAAAFANAAGKFSRQRG